MNVTCVRTMIVISGLLMMTTTGNANAPQYVGPGKCKICHNKKTAAQQYEIWSKSAHASAYLTLATDAAKKYATEAGIEGDPQKAPECLECHVTGYGKDSTAFASSYSVEDGVGCESCHGPGSSYKSAKVMSSKGYEADREAQHKIALDAGLVIPEEKTCITCHNKRSPAFKSFDYKEYYEKIKHEY